MYDGFTAHIVAHRHILSPATIYAAKVVGVCRGEREREGGTDRQTDRQADRQRHRQTDRQTDRDRQPARQTDRQTETDSQPDRQTDRQRDRQTSRQADRETERQIGQIFNNFIFDDTIKSSSSLFRGRTRTRTSRNICSLQPCCTL